MKTMPDPFSSHAQGVTEVPIREVISRLASLAGGPLAEYVAEASRSHVLGSAVDDVTAALDHLLTLWDDASFLDDLAGLAAETRPKVRAIPAPDRVPDLMEALEQSVAAAKDARKRKLTADQLEVAERHRAAQAGES
jgi:hypothetical protein